MTNEEAKQAYTQAVHLFEAKQYREALALLDAIDAERPNSRHIIFHRALCLVHLGRISEGELCCRKLEGRMAPQKLKPLVEAIDAANAGAKERETEKALRNKSLPSQSENIFTVQAVYPVSTEECSVTGAVKKGVFHVDEIANVIGPSGELFPAPIMRIGPADTPLLLIREGQQAILLLRIEPDKVNVGSAIICETNTAADTATMLIKSESSGQLTLLERPAELGPIERMMKQGAYQDAERLLNAYTAKNPTNMFAKRMLAQVYLDNKSPLRAPSKALYLIQMVYQAGGAEDPMVNNILAYAQAESGSPEIGLNFLERLYTTLEDAELKHALAHRIHDFRNTYNLGEEWEFANSFGEVIFKSNNPQEAVRAVVKGMVPLDSNCRRNAIGEFTPIEASFAPSYPEVAALFNPQKQQWSPGFLTLLAFLILGIVVAWFLPYILQASQ